MIGKAHKNPGLNVFYRSKKVKAPFFPTSQESAEISKTLSPGEKSGSMKNYDKNSTFAFRGITRNDSCHVDSGHNSRIEITTNCSLQTATF